VPRDRNGVASMSGRIRWAVLPMVSLIAVLTLSATLTPPTASARELLPPLTWEGTVSSEETMHWAGRTGGWSSTARVVWELEDMHNRRPDEFDYMIARGSVNYHLSERDDPVDPEGPQEYCTLTGDRRGSLANSGSVLRLWREEGRWVYEFDIHPTPIVTWHEACSDGEARDYEHEVEIFGSNAFRGYPSEPFPAPSGLKVLEDKDIVKSEELDAEVGWSFSGTPAWTS
jgi:hypothetical protein